ncbi:hypothetical protein AGMMS49965_25110 [Bacteroidia bacterium]|nr:hypothetical protein AGMMS49965_25110 [Bacteroidia bacterium]
MKIKCFAFLLIFVTVSCCSVKTNNGNASEKQTFVYSIQGTDTLRLDKYDAQTGGSAVENKPCVIFVFGGGFANGTRDDADYLPFYRRLVENGYVVVAIDYRLGLKESKTRIDLSQATEGELAQFIPAFGRALTLAVEDLFDASRYVLTHAEEWHVNPQRIFSCGSSAGAITVLQGEYELCNRTPQAKSLPQEFNYAGVISFAGAIFTTNGTLAWASPPAPTLLFHGNADREVPYSILKMGAIGMYGSEYIAGQLAERGAPCTFKSFENAGHEISTSPMTKNWDEIATFLKK